MKDFIKNIKFAWKYVKESKKYLYIIVLTNVVAVALSVIAPILSSKIIISLTSNNFNQILLIALMILITDMLANFSYYISNIIMRKLYRSALTNLEIDLGKNVLKLENKCLDDKGSGVFIQRLTNDTSKIADAFQYLLSMLSDLIRYIGILIAIFIVNKVVFLYTFVTLSILYYLESTRAKKRNEDDKISRKYTEKVTGFVGELVRGARDIKMLNSEKDFIKELGVRIYNANEKKLIMQNRSWKYRFWIWEISDTFNFMLIILLVYMMKENYILPSIALVLYNYSGNVHSSIYFIGNLFEYIKEFNLSSERVNAIIHDEEFKKEKFGKNHIKKIRGNFEFKNVTFGYNSDKTILKDLSFKIKSHETVAFVGKSGSGKSTIFSLLCKMYDVNEGSISIDGINVSELDKDSIRGNITIISQNPYIFNMSIRDNLKLVKSDLKDSEMIKACKVACLDEFINELPDKYDTLIGEGGVNLSGGQKQRLAIARALVQNTEIILFDEATSALDNETQESIQRAIENMKDDYTILIIAHRLSTIINSNRILYLDDGRIIAEGNHEYLLKNCKRYRKLYESEITKE